MMVPKKSQRKKHTLIALLLVCILLSAGLIFRHIQTTRESDIPHDNTSKTTSTVPSAQSEFKSSDTTKQETSNSNQNNASGVITDTNGSTFANTANPTSTSNGEIVVYNPAKNILLQNGSTVSGTSSLSKVSYRIVDNERGMISTGTLNVVKGKFSGVIEFQTTANAGQIDFFGTLSDGNEFDNLSIPVRFK